MQINQSSKVKKYTQSYKEKGVFFWYNLCMTITQINQPNYTAYQPYMLLDFEFSFQNDVLKDDLSITILEVLRRIDLSKFIDFHHLDSRSYDPVDDADRHSYGLR